MKPEDILREFTKNVGDFFPSTIAQRNEIYRAYEYRDCHQWENNELRERERLDKAITMVNLAAPIIRAVSGSEIMEDKAIDFVSIDEEFNSDADIMGDAVGFCQEVSGYKAEQSTAREDAATCGLGATVTYLDMTKKDAIAGLPVVERIFPGFLYYDNSSRGARLNDRARWCGYADPVDVDTLSEYITDNTGDDAPGGAGSFNEHLLTFSTQNNKHKIDMLYHYFWWEYDDIIDTANPFDEQFVQLIMQDPDVANLIGEVANRLNIDWQASYWSFDKKSFTEFKNAVETVFLLVGAEPKKLETSKRKGKCYYRAEIARGMLLKSSRSYTQSGHPLNFVTGYFDEAQGIYYGMMRPLSYVQDALNVSISDFLSYAKSASHGGSAYISGSGESIERIKKEKANEDALTPVPKDVVITPKALANTPQVLVDFIRLMMEVMPRTLGLGQEFFGVITSGDMTDSLYGKVMKQSYAVLYNFSNNSAGYSKRQGEIFSDIVRLMADANDGMVLPILSPGKGPEDYIRLRKQNLARKYAVRMVERPMTADEKQNEFNKLSQLAPQMQQAGIPIWPELIRLSNLEQESKDRLLEAGAPQPDPQQQALLDSQIRLGNAQAVKWEAEAAEKAGEAPLAAERAQSEIDRNKAQAAKALSEIDAAGVKPDKDPLEDIKRLDEVKMARERHNAEMEIKRQDVLNKKHDLGLKVKEMNAPRVEAGESELVLGDEGVEEKPNQIAQALIQSAEIQAKALTASQAMLAEKIERGQEAQADRMGQGFEAVSESMMAIAKEMGRPKQVVRSGGEIVGVR